MFVYCCILPGAGSAPSSRSIFSKCLRAFLMLTSVAAEATGKATTKQFVKLNMRNKLKVCMNVLQHSFEKVCIVDTPLHTNKLQCPNV